jgi:hypothetical protein
VLFALAIISSAVSQPVYAQSTRCGDDALTEGQMAAILSRHPGNDRLLQEAMTLPRYQHATGQFDNKTAIAVTWIEARTLILIGVIEAVNQSRNGELLLRTRTGKVFRTREPKYGDVVELTARVDPCHAFIDVVTE